MIGIILILAISWVLLYLTEKKGLSILGVKLKSSPHFPIGFAFIILTGLALIGVESMIKSIEWKLNAPIDWKTILLASRYHIISALTEDLLFRGAILYILIQKIGFQKAIAISAIAFGIYHWFSYGMFGAGIIPMIYVFIITGFTGYVWAYTYGKTESILMPLGFHFGWNLMQACFYETTPYGELIFQEISSIPLSEWNNLFFSIFKGLFPPIMTLIFVKTLLKYRNKKAINSQSN